MALYLGGELLAQVVLAGEIHWGLSEGKLVRGNGIGLFTSHVIYSQDTPQESVRTYLTYLRKWVCN